MDVDYPFQFDGRGRTAETDIGDHIRDLIEQVLFTSPGERVNRPTFGSGVLRLVFEPAAETVATATRFVVQAALQQWLGDLIELQEVDVEAQNETVRIVVKYTIRSTQEPRLDQFLRSRS